MYRTLVTPGNTEETLTYAIEQVATLSKQAIEDHGKFFIALSGGSTPKSIYQGLCKSPYREQIAWDRWFVFWSDERSVPPNHPESNYHMAMEAGLNRVGIPQNQIFRMEAEIDIEKNAALYEKTIKEILKGRGFDLMMLGMGDDGHTASLFPNTKALTVTDKLVVANEVPQHSTWRMTLTYPCINQSAHIVIYILGEKKQEMLHRILSEEDHFPIQKVGTKSNPALLIADSAAIH
jgi:6-phosphogluconolactonase